MNAFERHLIQRLRTDPRLAMQSGETLSNVATYTALERNPLRSAHSLNAFERDRRKCIRSSSRLATSSGKTKPKALSGNAFTLWRLE
jgi:hypothetical protein